MTRPGVVDAHVHVFRPAGVHSRAVDELAPADRDAPVEGLLEVMDGNEVESAVLVPLDAHDDYVVQVLAEYPERFSAVAVASPDELRLGGTRGVESLRERRKAFGFRGVRTQWLGEPDLPVSASPAMPVLRYLAEKGLILWTYLTPDQLPLLAGVVREVPDLRIMLNHLGFCPSGMWIDEHRRPRFDDPFPESTVEQVLRLSDSDNVHLMFSGQYALSTQEPPYADLFTVARRLAEAYGPARILWASDYPWIRDVPGYGAMLDLVSAALPDLDEGDLARVLGGNARRLFPDLAGDTGGPGAAYEDTRGR